MRYSYPFMKIRSLTTICTLCACIPAVSIHAQNLNIRGRVIDTHGQPVAGATVALLKNRGMNSTKSDGTFSIASNVGTVKAGSVTDQGALRFISRNNHLVIENTPIPGLTFELLSLEGRRIYTLTKKDLPVGTHSFFCPFDGLAPGLYLARIRYGKNRSITTVALLPKTGWRNFATVGRNSDPSRKTAAVIADSLMVYKKGYRSFYVPLTTADADLGDLTMLADTAHKEKFIILVRDSLTETLPPTSGWEYDPVKKTFTKKHDFAPSPWAPNLLLSAETPEYVRQQVPNSYLYDAFLYNIDYCSWRVDTLMASPQVVGLGSTPEKVFLYTDKGRVILDRQSGALEPMESFNLLAQFRDLWLVEHNNQDTAYLFSPAENRIEKTLVSSTKFGSDSYWLSDNGLYLAQCKAVGRTRTLPFGEWVAVRSTIVLFSLERDSLSVFPITIYCASGSGVPVIYGSLRCWFSNDGCFNYISALREGDTLEQSSDSAMITRCEMISINLQTLATTSGPATAAMFAPQFSPRFLPPYLDSLRGKVYYQDEVIEAFLNLFGIATSAREYGLSLDGKRVLGRFNLGGVPATGFIYGDLENRWIERLPDPGRPLTSLYSEIHLYGIADTCD